MLNFYDAACGSHVGKIRENNEDNFYFSGKYAEKDDIGTAGVISVKSFLKSGTVMAIFDGMGGGAYGEEASYIGASLIGPELRKRIRETDKDDISSFLSETCLYLNEMVCFRQQEKMVRNMGSTVAGLYFYKNYGYCFNLGDSRVYCLRDGELNQISEDHTDEEYMRRRGITGRKPVLTQHLGVDPQFMRLEPTVIKFEYQRGDRYLICSDGVTDMLTDDDIREILAGSRNAAEAVEQLIDDSLENGGKDNTTAIVCNIL